MLTEFNQNFKKTRNKKALAPIIATILLIALVVVVVGVVWLVINNFIKGGLEETETCFGILGKVTLNPRYTCYNGTDKEFQFSINIGDIDVDAVLVGISAEGTSLSFKINETPSAIENLVMYPSGSLDILLPSKNAGRTYVFNMTGANFLEAPDSISIAPVISKTQCGVSDSMNEIETC